MHKGQDNTQHVNSTGNMPHLTPVLIATLEHGIKPNVPPVSPRAFCARIRHRCDIYGRIYHATRTHL